MNLGTPEPVLWAIRSDNDSPPPRLESRSPSTAEEGFSSSVAPDARRSEKEVVMNGYVEKVKAFCGWELSNVSRLLQEEAIKKEKRER